MRDKNTGRVSHMNLVNGQAHHESLVAQLGRAPNRYLGGHGFDSRRRVRFFSLFHARGKMNISSLSIDLLVADSSDFQLLVKTPPPARLRRKVHYTATSYYIFFELSPVDSIGQPSPFYNAKLRSIPMR